MFIKEFVPLPTLRIHSTGGSAKQAHPHAHESHLYRDCSGAAKTVNKFVPIEITYPGSGNNSQFSFDGLGRNVKIIETVSGSPANTKQFIWCDQERSEIRDASDSILSKLFTYGQTISGASSFYCVDQIGSIREMTNSAGAIQAQYGFDPYGRVTKLQGSADSDFQYAGLFKDQRSDLNWAMYRTFNAMLGRWLSRDPIGAPSITLSTTAIISPELETGSNVFVYCKNNPVSAIDPLGLKLHDCCKEPTPLPPQGPNSPCQAYGNSVFLGLREACICQCMGNHDWANRFRGCLVCEKNQGSNALQRHVDCGKAFPPDFYGAGSLVFCILKCTRHPAAYPQPQLPYPNYPNLF